MDEEVDVTFDDLDCCKANLRQGVARFKIEVDGRAMPGDDSVCCATRITKRAGRWAELFYTVEI